MAIPDGRPDGWQSPDGRSFWDHYAHDNARVCGRGTFSMLQALVVVTSVCILGILYLIYVK